MLTATVKTNQTPNNNRPFPKLQRVTYSGLVYLMLSESEGVVVGPTDHAKLGFHNTNIKPYAVEDFIGTIEISQD